MPTRRLNFSPGIDVEGTETAGRGGWTAGDKVRFRSGYLERFRGWAHLTTVAMGGVCRTLHYWSDLLSTRWTAAGTNEKLYVENDGNLYDITPVDFVPGSVSSGTMPFSLLVWSLDSFGQIGMFCPSGHGIYAWTPPPLPAIPGPAILIPTAPPHNQGVLVTMPQQIVMAFGSSPDGGVSDPLLIRWSAQSDFTDWVPLTTNQAGSFRIPRGNRIVGALQSGLATYIWTENELWTAQYEGYPFVFGFFQQGASCGLISEHAAVSLGVVTYWMGNDGFFLTTGAGFQRIPCTVWDYVYLDLDVENRDKCIAATDYHYRQIFYFFPSLSGGTGEIDSYVEYNIMENVWDTGRLVRTAWTDLNPTSPIGVDVAGIMQQHNVGLDADGEPMVGVSATSGYIDMADGGDICLATRWIPDNTWEGENPSYELILLVRSFPADPPVVMGPYTITRETKYVTLGQLVPFPVLGVRGREIAIQINCDAADTWFRLGVNRIVIAADGKL